MSGTIHTNAGVRARPDSSVVVDVNDRTHDLGNMYVLVRVVDVNGVLPTAIVEHELCLTDTTPEQLRSVARQLDEAAAYLQLVAARLDHPVAQGVSEPAPAG